MKRIVEYVKNRLSPDIIELLISERSKGKTLRQLGQMFGRSHEMVRRILAKYSQLQVTLLSEQAVAARLGYSMTWLVKLRKEGIISPIRPAGHWLYSEEQVRQIPSLITERRKCERCGSLRLPGYRRFCRECSQYRKKYRYRTLSPEEKAEHIRRCLAWRMANPEKWKKILYKAQRKHKVHSVRTKDRRT